MKSASRFQNRLFIACSIAAVLVSGCGGGGDSSPSDTTPPTAVISPADGATGVEPNVVLTATFDEDMLAISIDGTGFTLSDSSPVSGAVSFDAINNIAIFTPDSDLALMTTYTASVNETITDLSGNSVPAGSISFTTRDGSWGAPALLEDRPESVHSDAKVATNSHGDAVAVWTHNLSGFFQVFASRYDAGTDTWSIPELVETATSPSSNNPVAAIDDAGNVLVAWEKNRNIISNRYEPGSGWGGTATIDFAIGNAGGQQIAMDSDGNAWLIWQQYNDSETHEDILGAYYEAGTGWGSVTSLESDSGWATAPHIAMEDSGNAIAVWIQDDGFDSVRASRYDKAMGTWSAPEWVESENAGHAESPQIVINEMGAAAAIWLQPDGASDNAMANTYNTASGWGTASFIDTESTAVEGSSPKIAIDAAGNAIAVWVQVTATKMSIFGSYYTAGGSWSAPELLENDDISEWYGAITLAMDRAGNAIAAWTFDSGSHCDIVANRYIAGSGWQGETVLVDDSFNQNYADYPYIAVDDACKAILTYYDYDDVNSSHWVMRFE